MLQLTRDALKAQCTLAKSLDHAGLVTHLTEVAPERFGLVDLGVLQGMHAESGAVDLLSGAIIFAWSDGRFFHRNMRDQIDLDIDRTGISTTQTVDASMPPGDPARVSLELWPSQLPGFSVAFEGRTRLEVALRGWACIAPFFVELVQVPDILASELTDGGPEL